MDAGEAKALGIVNTVVSAADVEAEAVKAAREISDLPPEGVLASRRLLRGTGEDIIARIDEEAEEFKSASSHLRRATPLMVFLARKR
jgi:enoyl-CoA hydratase/carnithine racemase